MRRLLYRLASLLGDVNAVRRGPAAIERRLVRKFIYRHANRAAGAISRAILPRRRR